ncbi:MAG: hypothetical protein FE78DRAFT_533602 [Acidomyces sp. 'richmondensis']|nr:MAG: hypothetical protein FE78DRAFT_533602 [Acidomyces sp. 'richmondensis']
MNFTPPLQWLPSVSWFTWQYVASALNFGVELNDLIQLAYVMPNTIPEIVTHYCIGVLWTVPIQHQFTYVVLAAAVMIRDIQNPWKRFDFYTLAILSGWYAKSRSACHWSGLLLSDLENTYNLKMYLTKTPVLGYLIISVAVAITGGSCLVGAFNQQWSFDTAENGIHPDLDTGKPIMDVNPSYPGYEEPTLSQLLVAVRLQILVELSVWVHALLS